eukprot:gene9994-12255_t
MHCPKYEVAVGLITGIAFWVKGPFRGSQHDFSIIKETKLLELIYEDEVILVIEVMLEMIDY